MTPFVKRLAGWFLVAAAFTLTLPMGAVSAFYLVALAVSP